MEADLIGKIKINQEKRGKYIKNIKFEGDSHVARVFYFKDSTIFWDRNVVIKNVKKRNVVMDMYLDTKELKY